MKTNRREFIKKALNGILALFGFGFLVPVIALRAPAGNRGKSLVYVPLLPEEEIPRSGVKKTELVYTISGDRGGPVSCCGRGNEQLLRDSVCFQQ